MILTLTANPSLDRTVDLPLPLTRGGVQRASSAHQDPGGKGVNVCRALCAAGITTLAVLPGADDDAVVLALKSAGIPYANLPLACALRSNITLTEPDGTTTKINEPGPALTAHEQRALLELVLQQADDAAWVVLAGSLPPGVPDSFYSTITAELARRHASGVREQRVAVDTSGQPLWHAVHDGAAPDLLKPNAEELAGLVGLTGVDGWRSLEADPSMAAGAAEALLPLGVGAVLATLGSTGAVLVTAAGSWLATPPRVIARSTVGAGDCSLAGYLIAARRGTAPEDCLRQAVAHGAAAVALPGTTVPLLDQTRPDSVTVSRLN